MGDWAGPDHPGLFWRALDVVETATLGATGISADPWPTAGCGPQPFAEQSAILQSRHLPYFWPNGKLPHGRDWLALGQLRREGYRLKVFGLVENPLELSIADMVTLCKQEQITLYHCIQGWSGVAQWGGLSMKQLIEQVKPLPEAHTVVFLSFGEGHYGGVYYDTLELQNALHPETLLAYEMNGEPLSDLHGAPLRLRVENQLGYKFVKWIKSIEFVAAETAVGKGYGGKNEDDEYYPVVANI